MILRGRSPREYARFCRRLLGAVAEANNVRFGTQFCRDWDPLGRTAPVKCIPRASRVRMPATYVGFLAFDLNGAVPKDCG